MQLPALLSSVGELKSPFMYTNAPDVPVAVSREGGEQSQKQGWLVSAPGKVILFGEHAVVHGVVSRLLLMCIKLFLTLSSKTAIASSVDLRCYGLVTQRSDNRISLNLPDLDQWSHTWDIDTLPWDAVTPIQVGEDHPPLLDPRLIDAITLRALPESVETLKYNRAKSSAISFLYLYMSLRYTDHKYVVPAFLPFLGNLSTDVDTGQSPGPRSTSRPDPHSRLAQDWGRRRHTTRACPPSCSYRTSASPFLSLPPTARRLRPRPRARHTSPTTADAEFRPRPQTRSTSGRLWRRR